MDQPKKTEPQGLYLTDKQGNTYFYEMTDEQLAEANRSANEAQLGALKNCPGVVVEELVLTFAECVIPPLM